MYHLYSTDISILLYYTVPILLPPEHTAINLTCVNNDLSAVTIPHSYWLTGCPTTYFNTLQSGVC